MQDFGAARIKASAAQAESRNVDFVSLGDVGEEIDGM